MMKRMKKKEQPQQEEILQEETQDAPVADAAEAETLDVAALQQAAAKADEYLAMAQRVQADFDNFRRRNEGVRTDAYADGQRNVATAFLPALDNLERALAAAQVTDGASLLTGVEMILKQMRDIYTKMGVTEVNRLGEKFDPNVENAVMQGSPDEGEPGTVCMVLQKGYKMGDHVLRFAMVKVVPD